MSLRSSRIRRLGDFHFHASFNSICKLKTSNGYPVVILNEGSIPIFINSNPGAVNLDTLPNQSCTEIGDNSWLDRDAEADRTQGAHLKAVLVSPFGSQILHLKLSFAVQHEMFAP